MSKASEKLIAVRSDQAGDGVPCIGQRLRELRTLAGLTQIELAARLGIGQAVLSRLEKRSDLQVSTLRDYVEALGATLRIDAAFDSATTLRIIDVSRKASSTTTSLFCRSFLKLNSNIAAM